MESNPKKKKYSAMEKGLYIGIGIILYRFVITPLYDLIIETFFK